MSDQLPTHWGFAFGSAFQALRNLVYSFDFQREAGRAVYVGTTPTFFMDVIDGFLGESPTLVPPANRMELMQLRGILSDQILPSFERGKAAGRSHWLQRGQHYGGQTVEALHGNARRAALGESLVAQGWFVEGFCVAYAAEETQSVQNTAQ